MSLQAQASYRVPEITAQVARTIFPEGNLVMRMYDELAILFRDPEFADLYPGLDSRRQLLSAWHSSHCCNSWKV